MALVRLLHGISSMQVESLTSKWFSSEGWALSGSTSLPACLPGPSGISKHDVEPTHPHPLGARATLATPGALCLADSRWAPRQWIPTQLLLPHLEFSCRPSIYELAVLRGRML